MKHGSIFNACMFDDFCKSIDPLRLWKRIQENKILKNKRGLTNSSYQVFINTDIDSILSTYRSVYHGQQCCGDKTKSYSPHINRRGVTSDISHDSSPNS